MTTLASVVSYIKTGICDDYMCTVCRELSYDTRILVRYRKALDTAVMIATANNVQPIRGTTLVYCDMSSSNVPCGSAKGLGNPRTVSQSFTRMSFLLPPGFSRCIGLSA